MLRGPLAAKSSGDGAGMAADYSRIHRLLKILMLIQGSSGWTSRRLAEECGTTQRTVFRDMRMLEAAGIPYFYDEQTRSYSVRRDFFLPPVQLTLDESLALAALAEHAGEQVPFTRPAARALSKVRSIMPPRLRRELEQIEQHVAIHLAAASPPEAGHDAYERVRTALAQRQALRCTYDSLRRGRASPDAQPASPEVFVLRPYALYFSQRAWYVIGHHGGRGAVRCLKLSRFTNLQPTAQSYEIPRSFSIDKHLGNAWRMIRGEGSYDVEIEFDAEFAENVADTQWHRTQKVIWRDDGSITFRCRVDGLDEIVWWILSMGPHCTVRKPKRLIERVRMLARATAASYDAKPRRRPGQTPADALPKAMLRPPRASKRPRQPAMA
jgi:predicted DNA-binding transcriptional regulator YafY